MDSGVPCESCGCTEYTQRSGFFICNNCDTQSQNIEVQHFEFIDCRRGAGDEDDREEVVSEKSFAERQLTSWECYNFLLSAWVDELVKLGASRKIRVLAFQLFAAHLQWSQVAYTSKSEEKLPALSLTFKNTDANILYGIPDLQKKVFRKACKRKASDSAADSWSVTSAKSASTCKSVASTSKSAASTSKSADSTAKSVASTFKKNITLKQRKKALDESASQSDHKPVVETLESLDQERASQKELKKTVVFTSSTRALLKEIGHKSKPKNVAALNKLYKTPTAKAPHVALSSITLITILRVALQLVNDEIYLADILRWIREGRLSVNQPDKIVPSFHRVVKKYDLLNAQRKGFQTHIRNLTFNLGFSELPTPNLYKLAERYCFELCLPDEFLTLVVKLMVDSKVVMKYEKSSTRFPDYECRVMAFILFVFKLVFSLDDFTELHQSAFADAVNESPQSKDGIPKLFSWNSWMKFVECRKCVLSRFDASIGEVVGCENYCEEDVFFRHWERVQPTFETTDKKINEALLSSLNQEIGSLSENVERVDRPELAYCAASLTPWNTFTEHILTECSHSLSDRTKEILCENFKTHSIKYATDSKWCSDIAESLKLKVESCSAEDQIDLEVFERQANPFACKGFTFAPNWNRSVPLVLHGKKPSSKVASEDVLSEFEGSICVNESDSAGQPKCPLKLPNASYWCFHDVRVHTAGNVDDFETLAIKTFPRSFLWLLGQCCAMLRADASVLYGELILVESVLHRFYGEEINKKLRYVKVNMDEW